MRRAPAEIRKIEPDPVYKSVLVSQVINKVLWRGKKGAARRIVYGSLETVQKRTGDDPVKVLKRAVDNIRPSVEVRSRRSSSSRASARKTRWHSVSPTRSSMPPIAPAPPSSAGKTSTRWRNRIGLSHTIAGN
jgi:ribosomal protein S7